MSLFLAKIPINLAAVFSISSEFHFSGKFYNNNKLNRRQQFTSNMEPLVFKVDGTAVGGHLVMILLHSVHNYMLGGSYRVEVLLPRYPPSSTPHS